MRKGIVVFAFVFVTAFVLIGVSHSSAQRTTNDFKVRYKTSTGSGGSAGTSGETITMIKGARERSETAIGGDSGYGFNQVNITQCDLKRTIQISDRAKKYVITPMESSEPVAATTPTKQVPASTTPARGGVVNYTTSNVDTGERKQMFGFTARHIKSSMTMDASANACNPGKRRIDRDGWYIDLTVEFNCDIDRAATMSTMRQPGTTCRDRVVHKTEGTAKLGYPLIETVTIYGENGQVMVTQTKEVVELSRASLDPALFDIPAGYTQATDSSELYAMPSIASMMGQMNQGQQSPSSSSTSMPATPAAAASQTKRSGSVLVGVAQFNNKANRPISLDALRQRLIGSITGSGIDAIPLNATSQMEAEAEAKVKQCDFILYTDLAALKMNKLGGMLGGITGVPGAAKTEAKLEYKLFAVGESAPKLQSTASAKEEGDENSAGIAVDAEARAVVAEVKKRKG